MIFEEISFGLESVCDPFATIDITLASVDDRHVAQAKRDDTSGKDVDDIGTLIHQVYF